MRRTHSMDDTRWRITVYCAGQVGYDADTIDECLEHHKVKVAMLLAVMPDDDDGGYKKAIIDDIGYVRNCGDGGPAVCLYDWWGDDGTSE